MTREEAIKELKQVCRCAVGSCDEHCKYYDIDKRVCYVNHCDQEKAVKIAIKALKQPEIIYCRDCKFYINNTEYCQKYNKLYCMYDNTTKSQKHYCSYAERKDD